MTALHETVLPGPAAGFAAALQARLPAIETARLRLRAPRAADFEAYAGIACSDRGAHIGGPMSRADAWIDFAQMTGGWLLHGHGPWSIEARADETLLGFVLIGLEPGDAEPELGFLLAAAAEGHGFAREAAEAARRFAWERLGLASLVSYIDPENARAIALAQRLGARRDRAAEAHLGEPACVYRHPAPEVRR